MRFKKAGARGDLDQIITSRAAALSSRGETRLPRHHSAWRSAVKAVPTVARSSIVFFLGAAPVALGDAVDESVLVPLTQGCAGRVSELSSISATLRSLFSRDAQSTRSSLSGILFVTAMGRSNTV